MSVSKSSTIESLNSVSELLPPPPLLFLPCFVVSVLILGLGLGFGLL